MLSDKEADEIEALLDIYDSVSSMFAPYQRSESSRGKYVDALLRHAGRDEKIKHYQ